MTHSRSLTKSIVAVAILSSFAFAVPTASQKFNMADVNSDGILTSQEFYNDQARKMEQKSKEGRALRGASRAPQFENVDNNKDGKVTFKEYNKFHSQRQEKMQQMRRDGRGDGKGRGNGNR